MSFNENYFSCSFSVFHTCSAGKSWQDFTCKGGDTLSSFINQTGRLYEQYQEQLDKYNQYKSASYREQYDIRQQLQGNRPIYPSLRQYNQKNHDLLSTSECCEGIWCFQLYSYPLEYDGDKCEYLDALTWAMLVPILLNTAFTAYYW